MDVVAALRVTLDVTADHSHTLPAARLDICGRNLFNAYFAMKKPEDLPNGCFELDEVFCVCSQRWMGPFHLSKWYSEFPRDGRNSARSKMRYIL